MENKIIFREALAEIREAADAAGGIISKGEIRGRLADLPLEEEHFELIYRYLKDENIQVADDREKAGAGTADAGEGRSLSLYLEELAALAQGEGADEQVLFREAMENRPGSRERLIEWCLPLICELAEEYIHAGVPQSEYPAGADSLRSERDPHTGMLQSEYPAGADTPLPEGDICGDILAEDLIQEGNLGLLTALNESGQYENVAAFRAALFNAVSQAMEQAIEESRAARRRAEGLAGKANHLKEAAARLEEELGHRVSVEELSACLEMPAEEIRDILRMAGDQIRVG